MELSPRVDVAFKKVFADPKNKDLLKSLINSIVSKEDKVKKFEIVDPAKIRQFELDKLIIMDVKAESVTGEIYNLEVQVVDTKYYQKRALEYWAETYSMQIGKGNDYEKLKKVIAIHILNFEMFGKEEKFHSQFTIKSDETGKRYFTDFEIHTLELPKYETEVGFDNLKEAINVWGGFFTDFHKLMERDLSKLPEGKHVKNAIEQLQHVKLTKEEVAIYRSRQRWLRDQRSGLITKEERVKEAMQVKVDAERQKAEAERQKAEAERQKAEAERQKAEAERQKAEAERQKAEAADKKAKEETERADKLQRQLDQVLQSVAKNKQKEIGASITKDPTGNKKKKGE